MLMPNPKMCKESRFFSFSRPSQNINGKKKWPHRINTFGAMGSDACLASPNAKAFVVEHRLHTNQNDYCILLSQAWTHLENVTHGKKKFQIEKAVVSELLAESPCALVASRFGWTGNMQRVIQSQTHSKANDVQKEWVRLLPIKAWKLYVHVVITDCRDTSPSWIL